MKFNKRLFFIVLFFAFMYYILSFIYYYINGQEVYIVKEEIKFGEVVTLDRVYKTRISSIDNNYIENSPIGKIATKNIGSNEILLKKYLCEQSEYDNINKEKVAIDVDDVDKFLIKYILEKKDIDLYYIKNSEKDKINKVFKNVEIIDVYDENGNELKNNKEGNVKTIVLQIDKDIAKEIKEMKLNGRFELSI